MVRGAFPDVDGLMIDREHLCLTCKAWGFVSASCDGNEVVYLAS